jgi:hypothetical protein
MDLFHESGFDPFLRVGFIVVEVDPDLLAYEEKPG